ncbi:MAG TPA: transposase [Gaiellaceae bacterium]|nr:transposase [Gaiellaceae bacterium]
MGRAPRQFAPEATYHVFARGSNGQAIFVFDSDRIDFLDCLRQVIQRAELSCLAYCLMTNHYHLVLETRDGKLSRALQTLNGRYAQRFNRRYDREAHLFKNRFGAVRQMSESQLLWTLRYTVMNPVAQGLCSAPSEWRWSSYRALAGLEPPPPFLDVRRALSYFGDTPGEAMSRYRAFVDDLAGV